VVVALQYQDITRQKLQHIDDMRSEVAAVLRHKNVDRGTLQFCSEATALCQAHGESVMADLDSACREISEGVIKIEQRLGRLEETFLALRQFSDLAISADGFIQKMLDAGDEVEALTNDLVAGVGEMFKVLDLLGGALSGLSVTMGQVSAEIRIIALNAQVQAIQNGLGTGLEILSARTCDVADDMFEIGEDMAAALNEIATEVEADLDACRSIRDDGVSLLETLGSEGSENADKLHAYRDRALNMLMGVSNIGTEIATSAREVTGSCSFDRLAEPALARANQNLEDLKLAADAVLAKGRLPLPAGQPVEHFRNMYTIADEVEVHQRLFGAANQVSAVRTQPVAGFQPLPTLPPAADSADAFLFDDPQPAKKTTAQDQKPAPAPAAADLGDNIELF
jgi:hypothetical protein